ncbi:hypothetical protein Tco_0951999 [Tanacetum coccineum]|uniref:Uncharacterized protein n=1 Tax=Tanacetum coccineum TaxID=301880 RepID=A0ABQ5E2J4_9ASTR
MRRTTTDEYLYEKHSPVHHHFSPSQEQAPSRMPMDDLLHTVPKLISRIDSLELDLKQTKLTMGNAIVKLVKKVKKLEGFNKRSEFNHNMSVEGTRKFHDEDPVRGGLVRKILLNRLNTVSIKVKSSSRPDIAFPTFVCASYQARPTVKHLKEVKRIFRYLRQSYNIGLWYPKDSGFELIAYSDADHAGCKDDCKSTSGGLQFLVIWMRTQLLDYGYKYNRISMYCDSKSAIAISCNPV